MVALCRWGPALDGGWWRRRVGVPAGGARHAWWSGHAWGSDRRLRSLGVVERWSGGAIAAIDAER